MNLLSGINQFNIPQVSGMMPNFGSNFDMSNFGMPSSYDSFSNGFGDGFDPSSTAIPQFMPNFGAMAGMTDPFMMSGMMDPSMMSMSDPMSGMADPSMMMGMTQPPMMTPGITDPTMMSGMMDPSMMSDPTGGSMMPSSLNTIAPTGDMSLFFSNINSLVDKATSAIPMMMMQAQMLQQQANQPKNDPSTDDGSSSGNDSPIQQTAAMKALADKAQTVGGAENTKGWCARGVFDSMKAAGVYNGDDHNAGDFGQYLANDPHMQEYTGAKSYNDLLKLPAGCIIQWDAGPGEPYGHITVTDGKGGGNSDHPEQKLYNLGTHFRVFYPK